MRILMTSALVIVLWPASAVHAQRYTAADGTLRVTLA